MIWNIILMATVVGFWSLILLAAWSGAREVRRGWTYNKERETVNNWEFRDNRWQRRD